jgi:hypothetical protein
MAKMADIKNLHLRFLSDSKGKRTSFVLPVPEFEGLLKDLIDLTAVAVRRGERYYLHIVN